MGGESGFFLVEENLLVNVLRKNYSLF